MNTTRPELQQLRPPKTHAGLSGYLWQFAVVIGVAQLTMSLWLWQFSLHLEMLMKPWQIGLTFSVGTASLLLSYLTIGSLSDRIGRRKVLQYSFLPMIGGLLLMVGFIGWPIAPLAYGLFMFGRGIVLMMERAIPADEIAATSPPKPVRVFAMVLTPSYVADAIGPLLGAWLITTGVGHKALYLLATGTGICAWLMTVRVIHETLAYEMRNRARTSRKIEFRGLGRTFWLMVGGMLGIYFSFKMAMPFIGNLIVGEWGVSIVTFGVAWSLFSVGSFVISYTAGGLADRYRRTALFFALAANSVILAMFGLGSGLLLMFVLNIAWSAPLVIWTSAENSLVLDGVPDHRRGGALGTYRLIMVSSGLVATNLGAFIWSVTNSLREVFVISSAVMVWCLVALVVMMNMMHLKYKPEILSDKR